MAQLFAEHLQHNLANLRLAIPLALIASSCAIRPVLSRRIEVVTWKQFQCSEVTRAFIETLCKHGEQWKACVGQKKTLKNQLFTTSMDFIYPIQIFVLINIHAPNMVRGGSGCTLRRRCRQME